MRDLTLTLGISEQHLHIVSIKDEEIQYIQERSITSNGTEILGPLIIESLEKAQFSLQQISRIACIAGPGSFTGLRLALTTAIAMRRALSIPLATLNYLHVIAASAWALPELQNISLLPSLLRVITYARQKLLYIQDFLVTKTFPMPIAKPRISSIEASIQTKDPILFMGSGIQYNYSFFAEHALINPNILLFQKKISISPYALLQLVKNIPHEEWKHNDPEPLYLRHCDAVDNLSSISLKQGKNPEDACSTFKKIVTQPPLLVT